MSSLLGKSKNDIEVGDILKFKGKFPSRMPQMFPKFNASFKDGEFAIMNMEVIENLGDKPIPLNGYGNITLSGNVFPPDYWEDSNIVYNVIARANRIDPNYGMQYEAITCAEEIDMTSPKAQRAFLSAVLTDKQVERLFQLTENPMRLLEEEDIETLIKVDGIGVATAKSMIKNYESQKGLMIAYVELADYGLTGTMIQKLVKKYESAEVVVRKIKKNPYILCTEVSGVGFTKADTYAMNGGLATDSPFRLEAFIRYTLEEAANNGFSFVYSDQLLDKTLFELVDKETKESHFTEDEIIDMVIKLREDGILWGGKSGIVALKKIYDLEYNIYQELLRLLDGESDLNTSKEVADKVIQSAEENQGWKFDNTQREAIYEVMNNQVILVSGRGGCVDKDTEYFNGAEWMKISNYTKGDKVLQFNEHEETELVYPEQYHNYFMEEEEIMLEFNLTESFKQVVSTEHNMIVKINDVEHRMNPIRLLEILNSYSNQKVELPFFENNDFDNEVAWIEIKETQFPNLGVSISKEYNRKYCFTVPSGALVLKRDGVLFVTGNSGKTTIAKTALNALGDHPKALMCLSGVGAANLQKTTGMDASTVHRGLGYNPSGIIKDLKKGQKQKYYMHDKSNPLQVGSVTLDEYTMCDARTYLKLLQAMPTGAKLPMLGDNNQLNSITVGNIARDLYESDLIPTVELGTVHRQKEGSAITEKSIDVSEGKQLFSRDFEGIESFGIEKDFTVDIFNCRKHEKKPTADKVFEYYKQEYEKYQDCRKVIMLSPMKFKGDSSVLELNNRAQEYLNPNVEFSKDGHEVNIETCLKDRRHKEHPFFLRIGDRIINYKNNYETKEIKLSVEGNWVEVSKPHLEDKKGNRKKGMNEDAIFNGFTGELVDVIHSQTGEPKSLIFFNDNLEKYILLPYSHWFENKAVGLAYSIGIYKSQGNGYESVIIAMDYSHYSLLSKELLYVAISRAMLNCILVGENGAIRTAIERSDSRDKLTFLGYLLDGKEIEV